MQPAVPGSVLWNQSGESARNHANLRHRTHNARKYAALRAILKFFPLAHAFPFFPAYRNSLPPSATGTSTGVMMALVRASPVLRRVYGQGDGNSSTMPALRACRHCGQEFTPPASPDKPFGFYIDECKECATSPPPMTDKPENPKVLKRRRELERRLQKAGRSPRACSHY